jgi:chaperonin GroEL (HSP60 family)
VNVFTGKVEDMCKEDVVEPTIVKEQAVKSATESASMILRIDDVIAGTKPKGEAGKSPGEMPESGD